MLRNYHSTIRSYISEGKLPLWVVHREAGLHPARLFHDHEYSEIALIISGSARHILESENIPIEAGDLLVIHPGASHAYDHTENMEIINLVYDRTKISLPILDGYSMPLFRIFFPGHGKQQNSAKPVAHLEGQNLQETVRMIRRLEDELKNCRPGNLFYSLALFMEILVRISRISGYKIPEQRVHFLIGDAVSYMNRSFADAVQVEEPGADRPYVTAQLPPSFPGNGRMQSCGLPHANPPSTRIRPADQQQQHHQRDRRALRFLRQQLLLQKGSAKPSQPLPALSGRNTAALPVKDRKGSPGTSLISIS